MELPVITSVLESNFIYHDCSTYVFQTRVVGKRVQQMMMAFFEPAVEKIKT